MKNIQTLNGARDLDRYTRICPHEHLLLDMTHEAVEPKTEKEKEVFYLSRKPLYYRLSEPC